MRKGKPLSKKQVLNMERERERQALARKSDTPNVSNAPTDDQHTFVADKTPDETQSLKEESSTLAQQSNPTVMAITLSDYTTEVPHKVRSPTKKFVTNSQKNVKGSREGKSDQSLRFRFDKESTEIIDYEQTPINWRVNAKQRQPNTSTSTLRSMDYSQQVSTSEIRSFDATIRPSTSSMISNAQSSTLGGPQSSTFGSVNPGFSSFSPLPMIKKGSEAKTKAKSSKRSSKSELNPQDKSDNRKPDDQSKVDTYKTSPFSSN